MTMPVRIHFAMVKAQMDELGASDLPVVDVTDLGSDRLEDRRRVAAALDRACARNEFLYIAGKQLEAVPFGALLETAQGYFAQGREAKMASYIGRSANHSGYVPIGEEQFGSGTFDLKEAYDVNYDYTPAAGRRPLLGPNTWPPQPGFQAAVSAYYDQVTQLGRELFRGFALALGLEELYFEPYLRHPPSQLRLIHYPFDAAAQDRPGIGAHTDYECFTLLFATAPGLQLLDKQGDWIDVPVVEGAMIMNIGDMMEILSNGRYLATKHRVRKVPQERYSFPLFFSCDYDTLIAPLTHDEPPRYAPLRCGEHLFAQTAQTFAYLKRRIASGELILDDPMPLDSFGPAAA